MGLKLGYLFKSFLLYICEQIRRLQRRVMQCTPRDTIVRAHTNFCTRTFKTNPPKLFYLVKTVQVNNFQINSLFRQLSQNMTTRCLQLNMYNFS